ncbi:MAG: radical SAM protein [Kiritimatiellia bacterium]
MKCATPSDFDAYKCCRLCPRGCAVDRTAGKTGICGETAECRIASAGPHFGEEPCFSGMCGSGTVFFTGCSTGCFFCQNWQISHEGLGQVYDPDAFFNLVRSLAEKGVHNINFVTPDHFWPHIAWVCKKLREDGIAIPFLFNSSGYHREDMIEAYAEHMDIFMPDFKFSDPKLAQQCMNDRRYPEIALKALKKMVELKGFLNPWDPSGKITAASGVLVRHLVLPGHIQNSIEVLRLLKKEFGPLLPISVMSQFRPTHMCTERKLLTRALTASEFDKVTAAADALGFENAFVQSVPDSDAFTPDFRNEEPFRGNHL